MAVLDPLVLVGSEDRAYILTTAGEFVESIELGAELPAGVARVGSMDGVAIIESDGRLYRSDPDITVFDDWDEGSKDDVRWSSATPPDAAELEALQNLYRGRGLTAERVLADLHSGRILAVPGPLLIDLVAVFMIVLSVSGLIMWRQQARLEASLEKRRNGER